MSPKNSASTGIGAIVERMAEPGRIKNLSPYGARFVYSLRLIALYQRAGRDPVPELAVRLGSVEVAANSLALAQTLSSFWPERVCVSCFCCELLSHDERTIGSMVDHAAKCDRQNFDEVITGLVRHDRIDRLWTSAIAYVASEMRAA